MHYNHKDMLGELTISYFTDHDKNCDSSLLLIQTD